MLCNLWFLYRATCPYGNSFGTPPYRAEHPVPKRFNTNTCTVPPLLFTNQIKFGNGSLGKVLSPWNHIACGQAREGDFYNRLLNGTERKHILSYVICHCLGYVFVAFGCFVIRHWCRVPLQCGLLLLLQRCICRCCFLLFFDTAVLQRVRVATVVK